MMSSGNSTAAGQLGAGGPFEQVCPPYYPRLSPGAESLSSDGNDAASEYRDDDLGNGTDSDDDEPSLGKYPREFPDNDSGDDDTGYTSGPKSDNDELNYDHTAKKIFYDDDDVFPALDNDSATTFAEKHPKWLEQYLTKNPDLIRDYLSRHPKVVRYCFDDNTQLGLDILNKNPKLVGIYVGKLQSGVQSSPGATQSQISAKNPAPVNRSLMSASEFTALQVSHAAERARALNGDGTYPFSLHELMDLRVHTPGEGDASWRRYEEDAVIRHMLDIRDEGQIRGEARFDATSARLAREGINRTGCAVKNYWNRYGRARSGFDERSKRKAPLATSKQTKAAKKETAQKKQKKENETRKRKAGEAELDRDTIRAAQNGTRQKKTKVRPQAQIDLTLEVEKEAEAMHQIRRGGKRLPEQQPPASMPRQMPAPMQHQMSRATQQPMSRQMPRPARQSMSRPAQQMPRPMQQQKLAPMQQPKSAPQPAPQPTPEPSFTEQAIAPPLSSPVGHFMAGLMSPVFQEPMPAPTVAPTLQPPSPLLPPSDILDNELFGDLTFGGFGMDFSNEWMNNFDFN